MTAIRHIAGHGDRNLAEVNDQNRLLVDAAVSDANIARVAAGQMFSADHVAFNFANNTQYLYHIDAGTGQDMHIRASVLTTGGPLSVGIFTSTTLSSNGVDLTFWNRNTRFAATGPQGRIRRGATVAVLGDASVSSHATPEVGLIDLFKEEFIVASGTSVVFRVHNQSGASISYNVAFNWYETAV